MSSNVPLDPSFIWAQRKDRQALLDATACAQASTDVHDLSTISFEPVALIEYGRSIDTGKLRLEPNRLVFVGQVTRIIPFESIVAIDMMGVEGGLPAPSACSVSTSEYQVACVFHTTFSIGYHIGAWFSRWLERRDTTPELDTSGTLQLPPPTR